MQEEWQDLRFMMVEGVLIYCHYSFYLRGLLLDSYILLSLFIDLFIF